MKGIFSVFLRFLFQMIRMRKVYLLFCLILTHLLTQGQSYTISGFVNDSLTGEDLIHATVIELNSKSGIVANEYGFYSINVKSKEINIEFSYVGYNKKHIKCSTSKDTVINIRLNPVNELNEIVVKARKNEKVQSAQVSMDKINIKKTELLPKLLGESDLVKTIQLLPGVQSGTEGTGGLHVRGGGPDNNLVLLDGAPVYNVNHLWGFFSVFNADAIQSVELYKGGFPARYGGRLSSVLDIRMKEGNSEKFSGSGSIGLISSKFLLEGPIIKNKTSFLITGRRTYIDLIAKPLMKGEVDAGYYFYDANIKINHRFSSKNRLFLSFYTGKDEMDFNLSKSFFGDSESRSNKSVFNTGWGNVTSSLRWNSVLSSKLFLNATLTYSSYSTKLTSDLESTIYDINQKKKNKGISELQNQSMIIDLSYFPTNNHSVKFGGTYTDFTYLPLSRHEVNRKDGVLDYDTTYWNNKVPASELHFYIEDDMQLLTNLKANIGVHASFYHVSKKWYKSLEPRITLRYLLTPDLAIKTAYTEMNQYVFQFPNRMELHRNKREITLHVNPEIWIPCTNKLPPQKSKQIVLGTFYSLMDRYEFSIEGFYKNISNVLYGNNLELDNSPDDWEDLFNIGKGRSYGLELLAEKKIGKLNGWLAYTLSKTERQFKTINNNQYFPYLYDRRHNLNVVLNYKFNEKIDLGVIWTYGSGRSITLPDGQYTSNFNFDRSEDSGNENNIAALSSENAYQLPANHRLDIGINLHKEKKRYSRTLSVGVYNAYNNHNSFLIYIDYENNEAKTLKSVSIFPVLPYVNYSIKF
jgi:outer membrane receptor for ferrienterochelin and colicin